ncbi:DNA primase [Croceibacterium sp. TMG7-5b_MA50]|uniref:DNA primase n=1 Tax=Croceibacterium sp. TMG7-5b_MA50 TaxID=3121290 RepID=UPI003221BBB0
MALTPQWLDELRARITLSQVIGRTTKLTRAGREWKACCPFHNEKSPSFTVNDEKGFYHCFGCGAHGDAIRWMTDQRGLGFIDAVGELAAEAGMEVPRPDPRAAQAAEQRNGLAEAMQAAQDWFVANLRGPDGARARDYLKVRGLDAHTIERFGFGYAPDNRNALKAALERFGEPMLVEAGLRIEAEGRENYDRFRGRLMLPIQDARGRVIAFGGRILDNEKKDAPKYLNSPDTPLFDKGRTLYNLHRASAASRQSGRVLVVEGYMDVIALAAAGFEDAVAPMGTALTEQQIELLWRMADKPVLCFDGDAAGQRAAIRAATRALPMLRPGHSLQFAILPAGLDPDDLLKRDGRAGMDMALAEARSLLDLVWQHEQAVQPLTGPEDKAGLKARLLAHVEAIAQPDIAALYRRDWLDRFSALAFPRRESFKRSHNKKERNNVIRFDFRRPTSAADQTVGISSKATLFSNDALHRRLGAAITEGLLRYPYLIEILYQKIFSTDSKSLDARIGVLVTAHLDGITPSPALYEDALMQAGLKRPEPEEYDHLRFPFVWKAEHDRATECLVDAVSLYVDQSNIKKAYLNASEHFQREMTDEAWHEKQRLFELTQRYQTQVRKLEAA